MLKNSPLDDFLRSLDWESVGEIAYVDTKLGLLIKNRSSEYWMIKNNAVLKLTDSINTDFSSVIDELRPVKGILEPYRNNVFERFINWLFGNERQFLPQCNKSLPQLKEEKAEALTQFIEADITIDQFIKRWDCLQIAESRVLVNNMLKNQIAFDVSRKGYRVSFVLVALFLFGFSAGALINNKFAHYENAEECILAKGGDRFTAAACYELYPSVSSKN